jgi:hypothetical protein
MIGMSVTLKLVLTEIQPLVGKTLFLQPSAFRNQSVPRNSRVVMCGRLACESLSSGTPE